ncbi:MAG: uncharacterized protein KVP18_003146 [Porospora cf. gigantea A]|uniref:uncharacterized protein n=1 Tax=Porospora cf. gigantea A TaxID=2853593 RepID=UPI00355A9B31|nr:MAG: hypothetical protein KVP18_003146 [Porospora cf. gigantea A]
MALNIPSYIDDPNYRYTMPKLVSKVEGTGNGVRTNVMNIAKISKALKRQSEYTTKFLGYELGSNAIFYSNEGKAIVRGEHREEDLQGLVDKFIDRYVLCPNCKLPEIDLVVTKQNVGCNCNACGHIGDLDNCHRLATYITKNPPEGSTVGDTAKVAGKTKAEKETKKTKKDKKKKKKKNPAADDVVMVKSLLTFDSPEIVDICERLRLYLEKGCEAEGFFQEARALQVSQDFSSEVRFFATLYAVLGPEPTDPDVINKHLAVLSRMVDTSMNPVRILKAFDGFVCFYCKTSESLAAVPFVLQQFYNAELLEEDHILDFYYCDTRKNKRAVKWATTEDKGVGFEVTKEALVPFLEWLDEDNEEAEEDDEEPSEHVKTVHKGLLIGSDEGGASKAVDTPTDALYDDDDEEEEDSVDVDDI